MVYSQDTIWLVNNTKVVGEIIEMKETSLLCQTNDTTKQKISIDEIALIKMSNGATFPPSIDQKKLESAYRRRKSTPPKPLSNIDYSNSIGINYLSLLRRTINLTYEHRTLNNQLGLRVPVYIGYPLLKRENQFAVKKFSTGFDVLYYAKSRTKTWLYVGLGFEAGEYYDIYDETFTLFGGFSPSVNYSSIDDVALAQFWSGLFCLGIVGEFSNAFTLNLGMDLGLKYIYNRSNVKSFAELTDGSFGFFEGEIPSSFFVNSYNPAGRLQFGVSYNF